MDLGGPNLAAGSTALSGSWGGCCRQQAGSGLEPVAELTQGCAWAVSSFRLQGSKLELGLPQAFSTPDKLLLRFHFLSPLLVYELH